MKSLSQKKGLTLPEILITTALFALLAGYATINLGRPLTKSSVDGIASTLVADLKGQQLKSMVGDSDGDLSPQPFGIRFEPTRYLLFKGSIYSPSDPNNFEVSLGPNLVLASTDQTTSASVNVTVDNPAGMVAGYAFSEGTGAVTQDSSGFGNTASLSYTTWTTGKYAGGLSFNGASFNGSYAQIADSNSLDLTTSGTISSWVKVNALNSYRTIVSKGINNDNSSYQNNNYALEYTFANKILAVIGNGTSFQKVESTGVYTDTTNFHHIALTWDSSTIKLYFDGVLDSSTPRTATPAGNSYPLYIGQWGGTQINRMDGILDEVRIYNYAMSQAEIQTAMAQALAPDTIAPAVSLDSPGSIVSGTNISLKAPASDNIGVAGVQFKLDGTNLQAEDTSYPYEITWNTTQTSNGPHTLTAVARDYSNNLTTSAPINVTVDNIQGLVGLYRMSEGSGSTTSDSSGFGNTAAITGATWTTAKYGNGLSFNGTSNYLTVADANNLDLTIGTVSVWFKLNAIGTWRSMVAKGDFNAEQSHNYSLQFDQTNKLRATIGSGSDYKTLISNAIITDTTNFHHVAFTWDGSTIRLYIDGTLDSSDTYTLTPQLNTSPLYIGQWGGNTDRFNGKLDEIQLYNRVLDPSEIPKINITSPSEGTVMSGTNVNVAAGTSSITVNYIPTGNFATVDHANLKLDTQFSVLDLNFDGTHTFDNVPAGAHTIVVSLAKTDNSEIAGSQDTVNFTTIVPTNITPTITITVPQADATISGTITITTSIQNASSVIGVQFKIDGVNFQAEDLTYPYEVTLNTSTLTNGPHTITAVVRYGGNEIVFGRRSGETLLADPKIITVQNATTGELKTITINRYGEITVN